MLCVKKLNEVEKYNGNNLERIAFLQWYYNSRTTTVSFENVAQSGHI